MSYQKKIKKVYQYLKYHYFPSEKEKVVKRFRIEGKEKLFEHDNITENSIVMEIGGYKGDFTSEIAARYNPHIHVFEPVELFSSILAKRFAKNKKIKIWKIGLSNVTDRNKISIRNDGSSLFKEGKNKNSETIQIKDIVEWIDENDIKSVSLMQINIEGGEYSLLERLITSENIRKIEHIQIQFHDQYHKNAESLMLKIQNELSKTHELDFQYKFVWENWILKNN
jgi:FkbM family methyltransferase